jgi:hypothetical protein
VDVGGSISDPCCGAGTIVDADHQEHRGKPKREQHRLGLGVVA